VARAPKTMTLIKDTEVDGRRVDVRIAGGLVAEIGPRLSRQAGEEVLDAAGGALLPGLTDHHLHLHALAAAATSVRCGPPTVRDVTQLATALNTARGDEHGWVRGTGYVETVAGELNTAALDGLHAQRPVRVQHRGGALWVVNTRAADALGLGRADHPGVERDATGAPTGRIWRADGWLRGRLPSASPPDLTDAGQALLGLGVTAVTDATPDLDTTALHALASATRTGALPQRLHLLGVPLDIPAPPGVTSGPYKIVIADSGLPDLDDLTTRVRTAHAVGRGVAAHCLTREALVLLLAALDDAGAHPDDRIEHAALVPQELVPELARRRLRVVTQPGFLADRGDEYLRHVPATDHPDLYRARSLLNAGIPLALSSDAPYGPLDPWAVIAAAVHRRTPDTQVAGPAERLAPADALNAYLAPPDNPGGPPRRVQQARAADLVLLAEPLATVLAAPSADTVRIAWIAGKPANPA